MGVDARSLLQKHPRGEGKTLLNLYRHVAEQQPEWKLFFFGDEQAASASTPLPPGIAVRAMSLPGQRFDSWDNVCLPVMAARARCDVLHCASSAGPYWSPMPTVLTVHDLIPLVADDGMDEAFKQGFLRRLNNGLRRASNVIAVSENTKQDILRMLPTTTTPIDVVHWGASQSDPAVSFSTSRQTVAGLTGPYLIAFGGEAPRKNMRYVLDRFEAIGSRLPELHLVLAGVTGDRERLAVSVRMAKAGLGKRVHLPGFVTENELDSLFRGARALFYPSLYEGFGMPLLEAIERGVPVVASDTSSIPEILSEVPGCFDLSNVQAIESALEMLAHDDANRNNWILQQRSILSRFSWAATAQRTSALLRMAAGR